MLAMVVNDDAGCLNPRGVPAFFASRLAPTEEQSKSRSAYTQALHHPTGRALARLPLLILIHPPPRQAERRCSSGDGRIAPFDAVEPIACRSRAADRRAMPPDGHRSEGTPSLGEGPDVRGERFFCLLFLRRLSKKVSRRKGETACRRCPKNGYVLSQAAFASKSDRRTTAPTGNRTSLHFARLQTRRFTTPRQIDARCRSQAPG